MFRWFPGLALFLVATLVTAAAPPAPGRQPVAQPLADSEIHAVCIYEGVTKTGNMIHGGMASVKVDRPGKMVTLFLSSYDPVTWEVTATAGTKIAQVIVGGYHRQAATVPKGVEVVEMFREGRERKESISGYYRIDSGRIRPFVQALHQLTGQELKSLQGAYRFKPEKPFVVDAIQKDERIRSDYPKVTPAKDLPKVTFEATHLVPQGRGAFAASFGNYTQAGPDKDSLKPLPQRIVRMAYDPVAKKHYGIGLHEIHEVNLEKGTSKKMDLGLGVPRLSSPSAITFDTKRQRLLVIARAGLYEYTPATGKWVVIAEFPRGTALSGLTYHAKSNTLYALGQPFGDEDRTKPTLFQLNAMGAIVKSTELSSPVFPGLLGQYGFGNQVQLADAGDYLAALIHTGSDLGDEKKSTRETFLFLIDPKTEKAKLTWKE